MVGGSSGSDYAKDICINLARSCRHIHPKIAQRIQDRNRRDIPLFAKLFSGRIEVSHYLYADSACVFPGVRRYVGKERESAIKRSYYPAGKAIIEDNEFPRHLWCFLEIGRPYSGPNWRTSGLSQYEVAHVFAHKHDEIAFERSFFVEFDEGTSPFGNFTNACNTVLVPKGMGPYTDREPSIKAAFFQRYIELYGESALNGRKGFDRSNVPDWYGELDWKEPVLPIGWEKRIDELIAYRNNTVMRTLSKTNCL
jgi:hypothetical protein